MLFKKVFGWEWRNGSIKVLLKSLLLFRSSNQAKRGEWQDDWVGENRGTILVASVERIHAKCLTCMLQGTAALTCCRAPGGCAARQVQFLVGRHDLTVWEGRLRRRVTNVHGFGWQEIVSALNGYFM
jgi:hypothetical protein